jgi:hypothetical protein
MMSSQRRQFASRQNGKKSRGPKSSAGRARSAQNSVKHGLSVPLLRDPSARGEVENLALLIAGNQNDAARKALCFQIAEAQLDLVRIKRARFEVWADEGLRRVMPTRAMYSFVRRGFRLKLDAARYDPEYLRIKEQMPEYADHYLFDLGLEAVYETDAALDRLHHNSVPIPQGVRLIIGKLNALERYERRALSKRNKALAALHAYDEMKALSVDS